MTEHVHEWPHRCTEIGPTVCLTPTTHGGNPDITESATGAISGGPTEHLAGFHVSHDRVEGGARCEGHVAVDPHFDDRVTWSMTGTLEGGDLTLSPSVLCRADGFHGFVTNGKWVPA